MSGAGFYRPRPSGRYDSFPKVSHTSKTFVNVGTQTDSSLLSESGALRYFKEELIAKSSALINSQAENDRLTNQIKQMTQRPSFAPYPSNPPYYNSRHYMPQQGGFYPQHRMSFPPLCPPPVPPAPPPPPPPQNESKSAADELRALNAQLSRMHAHVIAAPVVPFGRLAKGTGAFKRSAFTKSMGDNKRGRHK